jgi:predicted dehydrogenase
MGDKVRWGILGCASIAMKNAAAIYDSPECELSGVASRSQSKADQFVRDAGLPDTVIAYGGPGSYDDLLSEEWIDAVYIPLPTALHVEWVVKALERGKHVLVEKPAAINKANLDLMMEAAKKNKKLLMDGVMFVHGLRNEKLREVLHPMRFGEVEKVESSFSFRGDQSFFDNNIRVSMEGDPLGCLGDLGWYCLRLSLIAFRVNESDSDVSPSSVKATCEKWQDGVPLDLTATVYLEDGDADPSESTATKRATFNCSFNHTFDQRCTISARANRKGILDHKITMDDFVIPRNPASQTFQMESFNGALEDNATRVMSTVEAYTNGHDRQEENMFSFFSIAVKEMAIAGALTHSAEKYERLSNDMYMTMQLCERIMESAQNGGVEVMF